jgi:hypothetical protein
MEYISQRQKLLQDDKNIKSITSIRRSLTKQCLSYSDQKLLFQHIDFNP